MNITKKFGILATALAALAAFVPGSVQAAGDIRSIDAVATDSHTEQYGSANPVHVGQKIMFEIRLLNANGASQKLDNVSSPWMLRCNMPGWESTAQMFPLQVGLWMGGHRAWATLESIKSLAAVYADNDVHSSFDDQIPFADRPFYTRMIFSYEVQPGDIAMPVKFCNPTGTGVIQAGQELSFNNTMYWSVVDYFTGNTCSFTMGASPLAAPTGDNDTPPGWNVVTAQNYENLANWDLSQSGLDKIGFFVQTVDFDGDGDPWRTIPAGSSNPKEGAPVVAIPGNVAENTTVYVWTEDKDIVRVNNGKNEQTYTVKDPVSGTTKDYLVYTLTIANDKSVAFKLRADAAATPGSTTKVYLASTPTNVWTTAGVLITNFTSRVVAVSEPELPGITLAIDPKSITCDNNHGAVKAQLTIEPSQAFTEEFIVDLAATYDTVGGESVLPGVIGLSTDMDGATDFATSIRIAPGQERQTVYVFGLGFNASLPKTIVFKPTISASSTAAQAFYTGTMMPATLTVKEAKPVIAECPGSIEAVASADYSLTIKLEDSYTNLKGAYTVKWIDDTSKGTEDAKYKALITTDPLVPNEDGELTIKIKYAKEGPKTSRIKVTGPDGNSSDYAEFTASVAGAQTANLLTNREGEDVYHTYAEGEKVQNVRIALKNWVNETGAALYAFLVPTNTYAETSMDALLSKEKVFTTTAAARGIKIAAGETLSQTTTFTILDNNQYEDPIEFAIEIRTKQAYDDPTGEQVLFVSPEDSSANYIDVTNCPPKFKTLGIKGGMMAVSDGKITGNTLAAEQGVTKTFEWTASDVAADMSTLKTKWTVINPVGVPQSFAAMTGNPSELTFQYKFTLKGTYMVQAQMWDKDMDENDEESWTTVRFNVVVGDAPALGFIFPDGTVAGYHFGENAIDLGEGDYFRVGPLTPATDDITIMVKASLGDGEFTLYGADSDGWVKLTIPAGITLDADSDGYYTRVDLLSMDGTAISAKKGTGVKLDVKCVTDTLSPDGLPYSEYFPPKSVEAFVDNRPPTLIAESEPAIVGTNTSVRVSANQLITISWEVTDVAKDLASGLTLKWAGVPTDFAYAAGSSETSASGSATFSFSGAGAHTVSLYVRDKDKGVSETYSWTFHIAPSRDAYLIPMGPDRNGQSTLSSIYAQADGLGAGYVFAEGSGNFTKAASFWHYYSFTTAEKQPTFFATGYRVGDVDNGTLSVYDNPIDPNGNNSNAGTLTSFFKYDDSKLSERGKKDSFFYAWVYNASDEGGAMTGTAYPSPVIGKGVTTKKTFMLPSEAETGDSGEEGVAAYPKLTLEAVFAREYYAEDNMGDINADGVPDFFAKKYDLYTLMSAGNGDSSSSSSGGGDQQGGGLVDGMDVKKNVAAYNGDEKGDGSSSGGEGGEGEAGDFLPYCYDNAGSYSWAAGKPFSAVLEIRGFHEGLNEPGVSDISLSVAERIALMHAYEIAKDKGLDHACADAEEWMKKGYWSPETQRNTAFGEEVTVKRCDPTLQDTDSDKIPDGYEYYIWYMAKIGTLMSDGTLVKMTGSRFNPETPGRGEVIPAEVLERAFNPVEPRAAGTGAGRTATVTLLDGSTFDYNPTDFDEDGIPDWMEVALGTNPASWDTDGDGISDYFEVIYGTDPCDPVDADRTAHWRLSNPDRDFMALATTEALYDVISLADGTLWAVAEGTDLSGFAEADATAMKASAEVGGKTYYFTEVPKTYVDGATTRLLYDTIGYAEFAIGEAKFAVTPTNFTASTAMAIKDTLDDPAPTFLALKAGGKALPIFLYGGQEFVPACTNIKDNVETEIKSPAGTLVTDVNAGVKLTLIHNQVYSEYGFDPRTAWTIDDFGYVGSRWHKSNSQAAGAEGATGVATNTVPYTTRDEYMLSDYLAHVQKIKLTTDSFLHFGVTTCPSQMYAVTNAINEADNKVVYGADTDGDGIPDGWELYVGLDPNTEKDAKANDGWDTDGLVPLDEYAGTDSCYAYTNLYDTVGNLIYIEVSSITKNNPGTGKGWYNKFFPTDPNDSDTDGDGLNDDVEGKSWKASVPIGRGASSLLDLNFIYGEEDELKDDGSCCIRGGGLNPCTVDTDQDLLPDAWEYEFAGWIVKKSEGATGTYIEGGMDGTWGKDAFTPMAAEVTDDVTAEDVLVEDPRTGTKRDYDFDHDGLQNFQEYLVQAVRHFRYDDSETPLMGRLPGQPFVGFIPMQAFDGQAFFQACRAAGFDGSSAWKFRELGYFARPPHAWDRLACNESAKAKSIKTYEESEGAGYRIMLRPQGLSAESAPDDEKRAKASGYCCTDPRKWDTDNDGLDDYYELFHGLNPLFGGVTDPLAVVDDAGNVTDVIGSKYGGQMNACVNAWTGWPVMSPAVPAYDAMKYPWMIGDANCDADGDGLRNYDEALLVNITSPQPTHTDPTPLWMTDTTIANKASFTAQYYNLEPDFEFYPWVMSWRTNFGATNGQMSEKGMSYMFAFEENEGYDTDHDGIPDGVELTKGVDVASDPLVFADPDRRQAMWFPGEKSAVVSCGGSQQRALSTCYDMLRQFTVECWFKPERVGGAEQIVLERVAYYGPSTLNNKDARLYANFRLGINADGCVFGEFEGNTETAQKVRLTHDVVAEADVWVHYAFTFDGQTAALYKNDNQQPVAMARNIGVIPANGVTVILQEANGTGTTVDGSGVSQGRYRTLPAALVVGAAAKSEGALTVMKMGANANWDTDYGDYFKGYVDEIRVWDGARSATEIARDYAKRYTFADVKAQREAIYGQWSKGAVRNDTLGAEKLAPELLQHYNFQTMAGAVELTDIALQPCDFSKNVLDNVRVDGQPLDLFCGWWNDLATHSTVYRNYNLVPWIQNTVGHLPLMDGSVADSQYWSESYCGTEPFTSVFPNSANPYPYYNFTFDRLYHTYRYDLMLDAITRKVGEEGTNGAPVVSFYEKSRKAYMFQLRSEFVGTSDMIPLGGAYAKRAADYWDNGGAMDAWSQTGKDSDGDGLPDWWEMLHNLDIYASDWDVLVPYEGFASPIPAWEAYQRDLAKGMLPSATGKTDYNQDYASKADVNGNGIRDWWEKIHGVTGVASLDDDDNDGLSNFAEYLIGQCFATANASFPNVNPNAMVSFPATSQLTPDYFLKVGKLYLGEMFADHDFMEDWWERLYPDATSAFRYDANMDPDGDGWSNYAERRAGTSPDRVAYLAVDEMTVPDYPVPTVEVTIAYDGLTPVSAAPVVIQAWRANDTENIPDAIWSIDIAGSKQSGQSAQGGVKSKILGVNPGTEKTLVLGPGSVVQGSVKFDFKDIAFRERISLGATVVTDVMGKPADAQWYTRIVDNVRIDDPLHGDLLYRKTMQKVGEINYQTGAVTIDLSQLAGEAMEDLWVDEYGYSHYIQVNLASSFVKVDWTSKMATQAFPRTFYLSDAEVPSLVFNSRGHLREGKNVFAAFADLDGNGQYTPGEPYGVATDVDVGWNRTRKFAIQLTDVSPSVMRIDLARALAANNFASQAAINDRGVSRPAHYPNVDISTKAEGGEQQAEDVTVGRDERVRIVQAAVNGVAVRKSGTVYTFLTGVPFDAYLNLADNPILTERHIRAAGDYDLDWGNVTSAATAMGQAFANVTSMTYRVTLGNGSVSAMVTNDHTLVTAFVNAFEVGAAGAQTKATPKAPSGDITCAQPTFSWTHKNKIGKDYPAFRLRVYTSAAKLVYDSGVQAAPARNAEGLYSWTPPLYVGMMTANGVIFSTTNNYYWTVSMLDAKFTTPNTSETKCNFRVNTSGFGLGASDEGSIGAVVKYFGPCKTSTTQMTNLVHVQAFTTPDFSGDPACETYVTNTMSLAANSNLNVNAVLRGLPKGTYYLRAYIDTNGDKRKQSWESWGYACYVRTTERNMYTPRPVALDPSVAGVPTAEIYIEDLDTDRDGLPDAWEVQVGGSLSSRTSPTGNTFLTHVNPDLKTALKAYDIDAENTIAAGTSFGVLRLMSGSYDTRVAAATLLDAPVQITEPSVLIDSFSLADGLTLALGTSSHVTDGSVVIYDTSATTVRVKWTLLYKASIVDATWTETGVSGVVDMPTNGSGVATVSADEIKAAIEKAGGETSGFFKAVISIAD